MGKSFVDDYLPYLLARASHQISGQFHRRVKQAGLQVAEWRVLATLSDGDGHGVGDLARITLLQQPTLTKLLDRMARQGLVERRGDTRDGRRVRVYITDRGLRLSRELLAEGHRHEAEVLSAFSSTAIAELKQALRLLIERSG